MNVQRKLMRASRRDRRHGRRRVLTSAVAGGVAFAAAYNAPLTANATKSGNYPSYGFLWMSKVKSYSGSIFVSTNVCSGVEQSAMVDSWAYIKSSTTGTSEMGRWANGVRMNTQRCDYLWANDIDMKINWDPNQQDFVQPGGSYIGGRNVQHPAESSFCAFWNAPSPCGHRDTVWINKTKFEANSAAYQRRELTHETGHSHGLEDLCNSSITSMMNNGYGGQCPFDTSLKGWQPYDRSDVNSMNPK